MAKKPDAFLSYTRFDDKKGRIAEFRNELSYFVEAVSGSPFEIFQDVDDEKGIGLGQKWKDVLDEMLDQARFFIPILTPKFFNSGPCRDELTKFLELESKTGRQDLVLASDCEMARQAQACIYGHFEERYENESSI